MHKQPTLHRTLFVVAGAVFGGMTLGCVIGTGSFSDLECGDPFSHSRVTSDGICVCDEGYVWEEPDDLDNYECERALSRVPTGDDCTQRYNVLIGDVCYCEAGYDWCSNDPDNFECCYVGKEDAGGTGGDNFGCGDPLSNSELIDGTCYCEAGFDWCSNDPDDLTCCEVEGKDPEGCDQPNNELVGGTCYCETGYDWCSDAEDDYTCCEAEGGGGGTTGGVEPGVEPDPADCNAETEGALFCSHTEAMGPEGSTLWSCSGGQWTEDNATAEQSCQFDGFDFAFGCVDDGETVRFECGNGPGTACNSGDDATCVDAMIIEECVWGKLTRDDCFEICTMTGDAEGITYDHGECIDGPPADCFCCDVGDENCPA